MMSSFNHTTNFDLSSESDFLFDMTIDETLSATSHEEAKIVLEQWKGDHQGQEMEDIMDVDHLIGSNLLSDEVFGVAFDNIIVGCFD